MFSDALLEEIADHLRRRIEAVADLVADMNATLAGCPTGSGKVVEDVFLCENRAVISAAERALWPHTPPLVCTAGWPNSAVCRLLDLLRDSGARLRHHGDFDWDGLRIFAWLRERYGAEPWRFDAAGYRQGIRDHPTRARPLDGRPPSANDELAAAMLEHDRELHEEAVLDVLIADLREAAPSAPG